MLPRRAIQTQTAVRSTITRVGIKDKDGLLWGKRCTQKVNGQLAKEERDCVDVNRSVRHKMKESVLHDS